MTWRPSLGVQQEIAAFVADLFSAAPEILGIDETIPGCEVVDMDPYSVGAGTLPRYIKVTVWEYHQDVLYRGGLSGLAVGNFVAVTHFREGNRYEITGAGGAGGSVPGLPAPGGQGWAMVSDATPAWVASLTPTWLGTHTWGSGFNLMPTDASGQDLGDATHRWDLHTQGVYFEGASGANEITVPDNTAIALELLDAGGLEYMRVVSTNANPYVLIDPAGAGINFGVGAAAPAAQCEINTATATQPVLILQTTDDDATNPILEVQNAAGNMLSEIEKDGNLNFCTATAANPGIIEVNDTRFFHSYGTNNLFIGLNSGNFTLTGEANVGLGIDTLVAVTSGNWNMAIGRKALESLTSGNSNMAIGQEALKNLTTADSNVAVGTAALLSCVTGAQNVAIGTNALNQFLSENNVAVGYSAMSKATSGKYNIAIGTYALDELTTGWNNVAIGIVAGLEGTTNAENVFIGAWAGQGGAGVTQTGNTVIGYQAGKAATTSEYNVMIGHQAGVLLTSGDNNVLLGKGAGDVLTTGSSNIIIGYNIDPTGAAVSSELNIGALIYGDLSAKTAGVNVVPTSLAAAWHVDQATSDAAIPVLLLDQADVDQDMIEFVCTIGVGNAIETVGGKTLTTTHFIKVTLPGSLTRYIPVGTIA